MLLWDSYTESSMDLVGVNAGLPMGIVTNSTCRSEDRVLEGVSGPEGLPAADEAVHRMALQATCMDCWLRK